jgi:hypothetical protein
LRAARRCAWCAVRKAALSPYAMTGAHDTASDLPAVVVDAIHRVVTVSGPTVAALGGRGVRRRRDRCAAGRAGVGRVHRDAGRRIRARDRRRPAGAARASARASRRACARPKPSTRATSFRPIPYAVGARPELALFDPGAFVPNGGARALARARRSANRARPDAAHT